MNNKSSSSTITSTEVRQLLRTAAKQLSAREEKALRMRSGTSVDRTQVLPRRGQENPEARAELWIDERMINNRLEITRFVTRIMPDTLDNMTLD
jgi:hypothetical protein